MPKTKTEQNTEPAELSLAERITQASAAFAKAERERDAAQKNYHEKQSAYDLAFQAMQAVMQPQKGKPGRKAKTAKTEELTMAAA
jgi:hypothetical protein